MNVGCMAAQLDWQVSGNEFRGLVGRTRPQSDTRTPELRSAKLSLGSV